MFISSLFSLVCLTLIVVLEVKHLGPPDDLTALRTPDWKLMNLFFSQLKTRQMSEMSTIGDQGRNGDRSKSRSGERSPAEYAD